MHMKEADRVWESSGTDDKWKIPSDAVAACRHLRQAKKLKYTFFYLSALKQSKGCINIFFHINKNNSH